MTEKNLERFAKSKQIKVYGQVRRGEDASRKKASFENKNILTRPLGTAARLAIVGTIVFYTATVGYNAYKSMEKMMNDHINAINAVYEQVDPNYKPVEPAKISIKDLQNRANNR
ncbi:MAG: hypothetical protein AB7U85_07335 [Alphaproteobacteria bacterium]